jgi:hypothetical protein
MGCGVGRGGGGVLSTIAGGAAKGGVDATTHNRGRVMAANLGPGFAGILWAC